MKLIECKICGELCKDSQGLQNHIIKLKQHGRDTRHPSWPEYKEKYIDNPQEFKIKIDYIIPISNINDDGYSYRLSNLNSILRVIPDFINVILVEQMINPVYRLYQNDLDLIKNISITKKLVRYHTFNKGWLFNVGANLAKTNHIILAEGDININRIYFENLKNFIINNSYKWFFAWNKIIYWDKDFINQLRIDTPREAMSEGGLIYFDKNFYWKIGGSNECFQELGGIDNELASRARFLTIEDKLFDGTINHLWHPISYLKRDDWKYGRYYARNRILYYQVRDNPELAIEELKKMKQGKLISPIDDIDRDIFFKKLNVRKIPKKRGYK